MPSHGGISFVCLRDTGKWAKDIDSKYHTVIHAATRVQAWRWDLLDVHAAFPVWSRQPACTCRPVTTAEAASRETLQAAQADTVPQLTLAAAPAFFACSISVFCSAVSCSRIAAFATAGTAAVSTVYAQTRWTLR